MAGLALAGIMAGIVSPAAAQTIDELRQLSIEELANVQISSVSKTSGPLSDAPAAVYVISHEDIVRSGLTRIPELLRLAPNLEVAQLSPTSYAISARGFNVGNNASLSDKLLVLVDGRSVYTPLFGGVYWDMQQVLPENIERIEVISGPGATLWGANAVNGVINIITRKASDTQGGVLTIGAGNLERSASLQYGGKIGDNLTYRVHAEGAYYSPYQVPGGPDASDSWSKPQGGFRIDWTPAGDALSLQGDIYQASEAPNGSIGGRDMLASWQHQLGNGSLQLQAYFDEAKRYLDDGNGGFSIATYDVEFQHSFTLGARNSIVWGAGDRVISYHFENTALAFVPAGQTLNLSDIFGQDTIGLSDRVKLTLGLKLENDPFADTEPLPSARISWKVTDDALLWSAVSRAIRAPTPVDRDLVESLGGAPFLTGSQSFVPEVLTAYEVGTRIQASPRLSFSVSSFYNVYDDLRTIETAPGGFLPLRWGNKMMGLVYGTEIWGSFRVADWWRLSASVDLQHEHLRFKPGSSGIGGLAFAAEDPNHQATLRSSMNLADDVTWEADLRYVGKLQNTTVPEYAEMNTSLGWTLSKSLEVTLSGFNLLHAHHVEFLESGQSDQIPRSFFVATRWRF
ncbi:MAG TPA: TonB-dependent receptor [Aliidongia sp.]|uniref:TonB-dependent receptor plug domain-containing protein n=1 Tax=Aliidongia sp. TaxID=1914230 RepID=UPI002DDC9B62|nr:TonB-dependent receptor [Aliidongia sp.]HEV2673766.1 TonB-dependent receptor [Aliidongia sp.]